MVTVVTKRWQLITLSNATHTDLLYDIQPCISSNKLENLIIAYLQKQVYLILVIRNVSKKNYYLLNTNFQLNRNILQIA